MRKFSKQSGSAILFVILLLGAMLAITLTLAGAFLPKIRQSVESKQSINAIYAAESGVEWCLYMNKGANAALPVMANGAKITKTDGTDLLVSDTVYCNPPPVAPDTVSRVKLLGTYQNVSRALELSF